MPRRFATLSISLRVAALGAGAASAAPALAAPTLEVKVEVPRLSVAEYHRPYVAVWIEGANTPARTLSVWYNSTNREDGGRKWLAEMRQWWRKSGRSLSVPADGLTGATRAPGPQTISLTAANPALKDLAPGQYQLGVEAAREVGGEEAVKIPFQWPPTAPMQASAKGGAELGQVSLALKP